MWRFNKTSRFIRAESESEDLGEASNQAGRDIYRW